MITAKSMIGRPTYYAPNYVNVWFARDSCSHFKFQEVKIPKMNEFDENVNVKKNATNSVNNVFVETKNCITYKDSKTYCSGSTLPVESPRSADSIMVDLDCYLGQKAKPRKLFTTKSLSQKKKTRRHEKLTLTDNNDHLLAQKSGRSIVYFKINFKILFVIVFQDRDILQCSI